MAKRVLNRRELRKANDEAEKAPKSDESAEPEVKAKRKVKEKVPGAPKVKRPRKKKEPPRMCARWGVFDAAMRQVAIFDYNQRAMADQKMADLASKKNAHYFLQIVKEAMAEPVPAEESK